MPVMTVPRMQWMRAHLTFKGHLEKQSILDVLTAICSATNKVVRWSIVHEVGDEHEDCPTPYAHTHVAVEYLKQIDSTNMLAFDVEHEGETIHPNIAVRKGLNWFKLVCTKYHKGHKTKADGKKYYIEPVWLEQHNCDFFNFEGDQWEATAKAKTLLDALVLNEIAPKNLMEVIKWREICTSKKRAFAQVDRSSDPARCKTIDWDRNIALVCCGKSNIGKTAWAISQGKFPLLISNIEDLADIPDETDLLVFDEMTFDHLKQIDQVHLLDTEFSRSIKIRWTKVKIPLHMPRIFCVNEYQTAFGMCPNEAIYRRYEVLTPQGVPNGVRVTDMSDAVQVPAGFAVKFGSSEEVPVPYLTENLYEGV